MEKEIEKSGTVILSGRKENCPSGYRCRTRHPEGPVALSAGSVEARGDVFLHRSAAQDRNEKTVQLIFA